MTLSIRPVLAVTSETAFLDVSSVPSIVLAIRQVRKSFPSNKVLVAVPKSRARQAQDLLKKFDSDFEIIECEPCEPASFAAALDPILTGFDAVLIHDASRPMTDDNQFGAVLDSFVEGVDAVRPATAFTETLKVLGEHAIIEQTLDRNSVKRVSTPELIRISAISAAKGDSRWFLPLNSDAVVVHIAGNPSGTRINSSQDRDLLELSNV